MKRYEHIDMVPTKAAQENARRALEVRQGKPESQRGMTPVGIARARDISNGVRLSPETWRAVKAYFDRSGSDKDGSTWGEQGKGWQAWMGWGGDENYATARRVVEQMDAADREAESRSEGLELRGGVIAPIVEFRAEPDAEAPDDLTPGRPLRVISTGRLFSRITGDEVRSLTRDDLVAMADYINGRAGSDPVPWRLGHAWAEDRPKSADEVLPLGLAREAAVEDADGFAFLTVRSHWTPYGVDVLGKGRGALWPSLEWVHRPGHDRDTGEQVGPLVPIGIAVTPQPQYPTHRLSAVVLNSEELPPAEGTDGAEPQGADMSEELMALMERLDALEARLGALESAPDSDSPEDEGEAEMAGYKPDEMRSEVVAVRDALKVAVEAEQASHAKALTELRSEVEDLKAAKQDAEFRSEWADLLVAGKVQPHERETFLEARSEQAAGRGAFFKAVFGDRAEGQFRSEVSEVSTAVASSAGAGEAKLERAKALFRSEAGYDWDPKDKRFAADYARLSSRLMEA